MEFAQDFKKEIDQKREPDNQDGIFGGAIGFGVFIHGLDEANTKAGSRLVWWVTVRLGSQVC